MLEKLKKLNFKAIMRGFSIFWMIVFIVVMTITNVGIDKKFDFLKWIGNSMILFGITVYGLFIMENTAKDVTKNFTTRDKEGHITGGVYQKSLTDYNVFRALIDSIIIFFPLFYDWYIPQRIEKKKYDYLIMNEIKPKKAMKIVKYLTLDQFWKLKQESIKIIDEETGQEVVITKLEEHEYEAVEDVLRGRVPFHLSGTAYYLSAFADSNQRDIMEQGEYYKDARKFNRKSGYALRIVSGLAISLAIGLLTTGEIMRGNDTQAWMNLITRLANLFTAMLSGWIVGWIDVKLEAEAISNKTDVLKMFRSAYDKHLFKVYDEEEADRKQYEKEQKEKEEAKANVVDTDEPLQIEIK